MNFRSDPRMGRIMAVTAHPRMRSHIIAQKVSPPATLANSARCPLDLFIKSHKV